MAAPEHCVVSDHFRAAVYGCESCVVWHCVAEFVSHDSVEDRRGEGIQFGAVVCAVCVCELSAGGDSACVE